MIKIVLAIIIVFFQSLAMADCIENDIVKIIQFLSKH